MLKTKDNAGHAGHSQPLVLWNLLTELKTRELVYSLNKTQQIAQRPKETKDAMVD